MYASDKTIVCSIEVHNDVSGETNVNKKFSCHFNQTRMEKYASKYTQGVSKCTHAVHKCNSKCNILMGVHFQRRFTLVVDRCGVLIRIGECHKWKGVFIPFG